MTHPEEKTRRSVVRGKDSLKMATVAQRSQFSSTCRDEKRDKQAYYTSKCRCH